MLLDMESKGEIDLQVLGLFDKLIGISKTEETEWEKMKGISRGDAFAVYHLWRNSRLILMKARKRFQDASTKHENPKVAVQALDLMPTLFTTFGMLSGNASDYGNRLYEQSRLLRSIAARVDMLPDLNQELADVDKKALKQGIERFSEAIGSEILEE